MKKKKKSSIDLNEIIGAWLKMFKCMEQCLVELFVVQ